MADVFHLNLGEAKARAAKHAARRDLDRAMRNLAYLATREEAPEEYVRAGYNVDRALHYLDLVDEEFPGSGLGRRQRQTAAPHPDSKDTA